jgi:hypothetical protein
MKSLKLIAAIAWIELNITKGEGFVTMIQFEDGNGNRFNFRTSNSTETKFIDLAGKI